MNKKLLLPLLCLAVTSCGGGSGSSSDSNQSNQTVLEGVFIDSPVMGLAYSTATQSGVTDNNGTFTYLAGEAVRFFLGGIEFGSAAGSSEVTPLDLVGANSFDEANTSQRQELTNILIFLQSLDADQNLDNGIDLADLDDRLANETIDFKMSVEEFSAGRYLGIIADVDGNLIEETQALNHFFASTDTTISIELPVSRERDIDGDGIIDSETIYEYTAEGLPEKITSNFNFSNVANTSIRSFKYDNNGRLIQLLNNNLEVDGSLSLIFEQNFEYNDQSQLTSGNLIREGIPTVSVTRAYDQFGRLESQEKRLPRQAFKAVTFDTNGLASLLNIVDPGRGNTVFGGSAITAEDIASLFSVSQAPLNLEAPNLFGDFAVIGNIPTYSGLDITQQHFEYSQQGHVDRVLQLESVLEEGATEITQQTEKIITYDSDGRLLSSSGIFFEFQVDSFFSFTESGRLQSCSVVVDNEVLIENTDPISAVSIEGEEYIYIGQCQRLIGSLIRFNESGDPIEFETYFPAIQNFPFAEQLARVTRQEISFDENQNPRVRFIFDIEVPEEFTEYVTSRAENVLTITTLNSQGENAGTDRIVFEVMELNEIPNEQIIIGTPLTLFN